MSISPLSIQLKEWQRCNPDETNPSLVDLSLGNDVEARAIAQELSKSDKIHILELRNGLSIRATSYVGRITLGDVQITVQPKINGAPFVRLLRYAYDLRNLDLQTVTPYATEHSAFQELLIAQLVEEVNELFARGLRRKYVRTDDYLASPRGKINMQRIANQSGMLSATLPCTYYHRLEDCLVNQVLLQGLLLATRLTNDSMLRIQLYRLAQSLQETVSSIELNHQTFKKLGREMDRLTVAYKPAMTLIELLFAAEGITLEDDSSIMRLPGFLFNMNLFFQALLSRFLGEHLQGYTVQDQYKLHQMMYYDPAHNPRKRHSPKPRPDYVVMQQSSVVAILDAKYRDLWESRLPEHMLYQLAMYALSQPGGVEATILYPTIAYDAEDARIIIRDPVYEEGRASVVLRPVNLLELDKLLASNKTIDNQRKRSAFAERLTFGKVKSGIY